MAEPLDLTHLTAHDIVPEHRAPDTPAADSNFVSNLANSASNFAGNIVQAATHPGDTAASMLELANGYMNKLGIGTGPVDPATGKRNPALAAHSAAAADAMTKHLKDRYGSIDKIKETAYKDPIGFAADLSTVMAPFAGGAGLLAEGADAAGLARTANALNTVAKAGKAVGKVANPLNWPGLALKGAGAGAKAAGASADAANAIESPVSTGAVGLAKKLYQNSLKATTEPARRQAALAETGLSEGVGPADEGKVWRKIMGYADQTKQMVKEGGDMGLTVNPEITYQNVEGKLTPSAEAGGKAGESFGAQAFTKDDLDHVNTVLDNWVKDHYTDPIPANPGTVIGGQNTPNPTVVGASPAVPAQPQPIPIEAANEIKSGTYQNLAKKAFGKSAAGATETVPVAKEQAQLEIARDLRRQIGENLEAAGIGNIHDPNAAEGRLLDLQPFIEKNAARKASTNILNPKAALLDHLQPLVAQALYKAGKIDEPTFKYILRQGVTGSAQQQDAQPGTQ